MGPHTRDCSVSFQNPFEVALVCPFGAPINMICFERYCGLQVFLKLKGDSI